MSLVKGMELAAPFRVSPTLRGDERTAAINLTPALAWNRQSF